MAAHARSTFRPVFPVLLIAVLVGCSDTTQPGTTVGEGGAGFNGAVDPGAGTFVLARLEETFPEVEPVRIDLLGSNLQAGDGSVSLDVSVRNADPRPLFAPGTVWVSRFSPTTVYPTNPDVTRDSTGSAGVAYGFDYSGLLGDDETLRPGEISSSKTWVFNNPDLEAFSFAAEARFALVSETPFIAGVMFEDRNLNGEPDPGEGPFLAGWIHLQRPDGVTETAWPGQDGRFRFPARSIGLYTLRFESMVDCILCVTTPNPLEVVLTSGPGGFPESYPDADFGVFCGPCPDLHQSVVMTTSPPEDVELDPYRLEAARIEGNLLLLEVGFGGCQSDHPFTLYAGRAFEMTDPVRTWLRLAHDGLGETCRCDPASRCWYVKVLAFDLAPIRKAYLEDFGVPGPVQLILRDPAGEEHEFLLDG